MSMTDFLFTSESVTEGHPDKISDQISDAILDAIIKEDIGCRVACETLVTTGLVFVAGEITTSTYVEIPEIARGVIRDVGYNSSQMGFDWESCSVLTSIHHQSSDIAMGVDPGGAGDQGLMFGYACNETQSLMPMPIVFAHQLTRRLTKCRKEGILEFLRPDGKSQVTIEYRGYKPVRIDAVVLSSQHHPDIGEKALRAGIIEEVARKVLPSDMLDDNTKFYVNPTGRFVMGGPMGDTGLTGRKIIVDTYGGQGSHGGGCFSGKDPSKVDRSASYMARYIAKNVVAAGLAERCEVQLAYAIGISDPVSVMINSFRTSKISPDRIAKIIRDIFPLKPRKIIEALDLLRPIYRNTASYGHFGRDEPEFTWERTDKVEELRSAAGL
ncbi:MAG TPA: methionine adenosyltransferase [Proteobacteria bacterium]|nr:S-adenosylmethionine synthase [bacterium BMS3Abin14]HDL52864.1 methionine adenosyltransferase [Pseudomonadota bacterium]